MHFQTWQDKAESHGLRNLCEGTAKLSRIREHDSPKFGFLKQLFFEYGPHAFTLARADRHRLTTGRFTLIRLPLLRASSRARYYGVI